MKIEKATEYKAHVLVEGKVVAILRKCSRTNKWNGFAKGKTPTLPKTSMRQAAIAILA